MTKSKRNLGAGLTLVGGALIAAMAIAAEPNLQPTSYMPVDIKESFASTMARMKAGKPAVEARQKALLEKRYDLSNRPAAGVTMSRGKPVQEGVRTRLPRGIKDSPPDLHDGRLLTLDDTVEVFNLSSKPG